MVYWVKVRYRATDYTCEYVCASSRQRALTVILISPYADIMAQGENQVPGA